MVGGIDGSIHRLNRYGVPLPHRALHSISSQTMDYDFSLCRRLLDRPVDLELPFYLSSTRKGKVAWSSALIKEGV